MRFRCESREYCVYGLEGLVLALTLTPRRGSGNDLKALYQLVKIKGNGV